MAEAPSTSIEASSPVRASSSPQSTPPDPSDEATPRLKSPWSQIVRGSPNPPRSKADTSSCSLQPDYMNEKHLHHHAAPELRVTDLVAAVVNASPISSPSDDRRQCVPDISMEKSMVSPDWLINDSIQVDSKLPQQSPVKSPKQAWGKPISNPAMVLEPEPVMGGIAWPPLSEARNIKPSDSLTAGPHQKTGSKSPPLSNERHHIQAPFLSHKEIGSKDQKEVVNKQNFEIMVNGSNPSSSGVLEAASPGKSGRPTDAEQSKRSGVRDSRNAAASEGSPVHQRSHVTSLNPNKESVRNFMWDQGRGNNSFPAYGRVRTHMREQALPGHHQRVGQRNYSQPFVPFVNPNPGFVHPAGYQNVPGSMYYMPAPTSEPVLGPTYFVPTPIQGMYMPGSEFSTIQGLLVRQIEYYFSVENLCRDLYLRGKMDERGFVPFSVIASFNRVKSLTQHPYLTQSPYDLITDALRCSNVLEVQGDKVRKRGDWANWLLPSRQPLSTLPGDQAVRFSTPSRKAVDGSKSEDSRSLGADNQINGHSHVASQTSETVEAQFASALNEQDVLQESSFHEEKHSSLEDKLSQDLQLLDNKSKYFTTQNFGVESGSGVE